MQPTTDSSSGTGQRTAGDSGDLSVSEQPVVTVSDPTRAGAYTRAHVDGGEPLQAPVRMATPAAEDEPISLESESPEEGSSVPGSPTHEAVVAGGPERRPRIFSLFRFNRTAVLMTAAIMAVLALLIGGGVLLFNNDRQDGLSSKGVGDYSNGKLSLGNLKPSDDLQVGNASQLAINGLLKVNDSLVLVPTTTPVSPVAGQFYYNKADNTAYFYNGSQFVSLSPVRVSSIGGQSGAIGLDTSLQITNNNLGISGQLLQQITQASAAAASAANNGGPRVTSLQGLTGDVTLNGGAGITINGTTISNSGLIGLTSGSGNLVITNDGAGNYTITDTSAGSGVTSLTGTPNQINVSSSTGNVTLSLPQDIAVSSAPTFGGLTVTGTLAVQGASGLTVGNTGVDGKLTLTSSGGGSVVLQSGATASNLAFTLPVADGSNGACLMTNGSGVLSFQTCTGGPGGGVTSINGQTGIVTINNASGSGSTITIDNAAANGTTKGIAAFNATNFSDNGSGVINTVQDIATTASPTFAGLTINGTATATTLNATSVIQINGVQIASSNLSDGSNLAKLNGTGPQVFTGNNRFTGTLTAQLTSPTAFQVQDGLGTSNLFVANTSTDRVGIGTLGPGYKLDVQGGDINTSGIYRVNGAQISSANLSNDSDLAKLSATNTFTAANTFTGTVSIQGSNSLTLGSGSNVGSLILRDGSSANTGTLRLAGVLSGNATYNLPVATGTQTVCTVESGNCAGSGSGITGSGTPNKLAKFTGTQAVGDSSISDDGTVVTVSTGQVIQGAAGLTIGATGVDGKMVLTNSVNNNTLTLQSGATTGNLTLTLPTADGSNGYCLKTDGAGTLSFAACTGGPGGGVTSINTLTGVLNIVGTANQVSVSTAGNTITLSLPQDINTGGNANFRTVTLTGQAAGDNLIVANAVSGATGKLIDLQVNGSSQFTVTPGGNVNTIGQYQINGVQIASSNLSDGSNLAKLNGTGPQVFTGDNKFTGTTLVQLDSGTAFQIQNGTGSSNLFVADTNNTRIGIGTNTPGYTLDVNGDVNTTGVYRINGITVCSASGCTPASGSGSYIQNGTAPQTANFNITGNGVIGTNLTVNGDISSPGSGTNSEHFGALSSIGSNNYALAVGNSATVIGDRGTAIGQGAVTSFAGTALGASASANAYSIAIGYGATTTAADQLVIGSATDAIYDGYIGNGVTNAAPTGFTLHASGGSGADIQGASLGLAGGQGTGTGAGGNINFQVAKPAGVSGSSLNNLATVASLSGVNGAALFQNSANSTTGFQIQNAAGTSNLFVADTQNTRIAVGQATANYTLDVNGDINIASGASYRIGGTAICTSSGCTPASGSGSYIQNGTSPQTANFNITGNGTIGSVLAVGGNANITGNLIANYSGLQVTVGSNCTSTDHAICFGNGINLYNYSNGTALATDGLFQSANLYTTGALSFGTFHMTSFTTPTGATVDTKINIPLFDPGAFSQLIALGLPAGSATTARAITVFDARTTTNNQPPLAVISPNESNIFGLSWEGASTTGYLKVGSGGAIGLRSGSNDLANFTSGGAATFKTASPVTNAFQLIDNSNQTYLQADSQNHRLGVGLGAAPANGVLTVGTNATTTASGGIYFGTDTNLYRDAPGELATDSALNVNGAYIFISGPNSEVGIYRDGYIQPVTTNATDLAFNTAVYNESYGRLSVTTAGVFNWGDGANPADTTLYRGAAGQLNTGGSLFVNNNIGVGGTINIQGTALTTSSTSFDLLNTTATTLNFGGAASTLNIGPGGSTATSINLAGGSGATGCTIDGTTGNLTCSGNITGGSTGTVGYWSRGGTTLQPATAGDSITTSGNLSTTGSGTLSVAGTSALSGAVTISANGGQTTLALTSTGSNTGITFGGDTNLYRSTNNTLKTDSNVIIQNGSQSIYTETPGGGVAWVFKNQGGLVSSIGQLDSFGGGIGICASTTGTVCAYNGQQFRMQAGGATTLQNTTDSSSAFQIQNAAGQSVVNVNTSNATVTIMSPSFTYVGGADASGSANSGTGSSSFNNSAISGRYQYVAKGSNATACSQSVGSAIGCELQVYDISNPASPTYVGGADASGSTNSGTGASSFFDISVSGHYAYVVSSADATTCSQTAGSAIGCEFKIFDISNPAAPTYVGGADSGGLTNSGTSSVDMRALTVSGRYAYVTTFGNAGGCSGTAGTASRCELQVYDISNPAAPTYQGGANSTGTTNSGSGSNAFNDVEISGNYVYVVTVGDATACSQTVGSAIGCELKVFNVATPSTPTYVGGADVSGSTNSGTGNLNISDIAISGKYAYVATSANSTACSQTAGSAIGCELKTFDISTPATPTYIGGADASGTANSGTGTGTFSGLATNSHYVYVVGVGSATACAQTAGNAVGCELKTFDVATPSAPVYTGGADASGSTNSGTGSLNFNGVTVGGRYVYASTSSSATACSQSVGSAIGCELKGFSISGLDTPGLLAGSTETGSLQVNNNSLFYGDLSVEGNLSVGGQVTFKNTTDSTKAFQIERSNGAALFTADTVNSRITVSGTSTTAFQVQNAAGSTTLNVNTQNSTVTVTGGTDTATLGTELFTGSTSFTTGSGWTSNGLSGQSAAVTHTTGTTAKSPTPAIGITSGNYYLVTWDVTNPNNGGTLSMTLGGQTLATYTFDNNNSGSYTLSDSKIIQASSTANLSLTPNSAFTGTVGNISIKQLTYNNAPAFVINNTSGVANLEVRASSNFNNQFMGLGSGAANATGFGNLAVGSFTLQNNVSGTANTALGQGAMQNNISGSNNSALGFAALNSNTSGELNVALGAYALNSNLQGSANVAIGANTLQSNIDGYDNIAIGHDALIANTSGNSQVAIGSGSLQSVTTAGGNTAVGYATLRDDVTGYNNTAIGQYALEHNTFNENTAVGTVALRNNTTGGQNTALGTYSLSSNTTGSNNLAIGYSTLNTNVTGSNNTALGDEADVMYSGLQNATAIGSGALVGSSNTIILGYNEGWGVYDHVGIGTSYAQNPFVVAPNTYDTGTISQSGGVGTVVGSGTTFSSTMIGGTIFYPNGTQGIVTAVADATHLTSSNTTGGWPAGTTYAIVWGGFNVNDDASVFIQPTANTLEALTVADVSGNAVLRVSTSSSDYALTVDGGIESDGDIDLTNNRAITWGDNFNTSIQGQDNAGSSYMQFKVNNNVALSIGSDGAVSFQGGSFFYRNSADSANAFEIKTQTSNLDIFNIATNTGAVTIGTTANTGTLTLGQSTQGETINIGNATVATTKTNTINIGTSSTGTGKDLISIGSTNGASATTINAGTGNALINATSGTVTLQTTTSGAINIKPAGSSNVVLGTADSTGTLLVLDTKNTTGDPTAVAGGLYYNSATGSFRCAYSYNGGTNTIWQSCGPQTRELTADQASTSSTLADVTNMTFAIAANTDYSITCNVSYTSASTTNGIKLAFNGPASPTSIVGDWESYDATTTSFQGLLFRVYDLNLATSNVDTAGALVPSYLKATIRNGANAGTLALRFASENGGTSVSVKAGTSCSLTQL